MIKLKGLKTKQTKNWLNYNTTKSTNIQVLTKNIPSNGSLKCEEKTMVDQIFEAGFKQ